MSQACSIDPQHVSPEDHHLVFQSKNDPRKELYLTLTSARKFSILMFIHLYSNNCKMLCVSYIKSAFFEKREK